MQPYQCLLQLIEYVGLYGTLPYVTNLLLPYHRGRQKLPGSVEVRLKRLKSG